MSKSDLRILFEAYCDTMGLFEEEHYYMQGSCSRRIYNENIWQGWLGAFEFIAASTQQPMQCPHCIDTKNTPSRLCYTCKNTRLIPSPLGMEQLTEIQRLRDLFLPKS